MIRKYIFGNPFETYAVVDESGVDSKMTRELLFAPVNMYEALKPYGGLSWDRPESDPEGNCTDAYVFTDFLNKDDVVYGLGENVRGINKRGWLYESKCSDDPNHIETKYSLYGAHNFFIVAKTDGNSYGIFVDYPGRVMFDIGYLVEDEIKITVCNENFKVYKITSEDGTIESIVTQFRGLIGKSYVPPMWAFGFMQSRWSYGTADEVRNVVKNYRENNIPIDAVFLDIDYMERYKDFTVDEDRFPDFEEFVKEMKDEHIHLVPIIDAGVKIEEGYKTYEEGVEKGYFCKEENGEDFVAGVWPGRVHFPDVLNKEAAEWFGDGYKCLLDAGIDGFWNDMNEPAIFYSEKHLKEVFEKIMEYEKANLDIQSFFQFKDVVGGLSNNLGDYERFYHNATQPEGNVKIRHDHVHNLYGYNMTRAAGEAFKKLAPDKDILIFSRASYIGMHRYGGIWTGDNHSWWSHILLTLKMLPSLNMCGFMYVGSDLGGFNENATKELVMRWVELGIFVPLMRNHAAMGTRFQELYRFGANETFKKLIEIRYALIPYLWKSFNDAVENNTMMYRPLGFVHPQDKYARNCEDQLYVGDSIMICPVYTANTIGRSVYLPEAMRLVRMRSVEDYEVIPYERGHHFVDIAEDEVVFFIRKDRKLTLAKPAQWVDDIVEEGIEI